MAPERLYEVKGSKSLVLFSIFTIATVKIRTRINGGAIKQEDGNQRGFTTEISIWIPLEGDDEFNVFYNGEEVWPDPVVTCPAPRILVFPTSDLGSTTVITLSPYTTSVEYGAIDTTTVSGQVISTFITTINTTSTPVIPLDPTSPAYFIAPYGLEAARHRSKDRWTLELPA